MGREELYSVALDYQKAFDTVWQEGLLQSMLHIEYPSKIVLIQKLTYLSNSMEYLLKYKALLLYCI